jgi:hypothetical protein
MAYQGQGLAVAVLPTHLNVKHLKKVRFRRTWR